MNTRVDALPSMTDATSPDAFQLSPAKVGMLIRLFAAGFAFICIFPLLSSLLISRDLEMANRLAPSIFGSLTLCALIVFQGRVDQRRALLVLWAATLVIMIFHQYSAQVGIRGLVNTVLVLLVALTGLVAGPRAGRAGVFVAVVYLASLFTLEQAGYIEGIQGKNSPNALGCLIFYAMMVTLASALTRAFCEAIQQAARTEIEARQARVLAEENMRHSEALLNFRTDLLTSVASKLKQPLLAIREDLAVSEIAGGQTREQLDKIGLLTRSIDETLDSLIDSIKAQVGELELHNEDFNLLDLLSDINSTWSSAVKDVGLLWVFTPASSLNIELNGSAVHIRQQINHLLNVSLAHTRKGFIRLGASVKHLPGNDASQQHIEVRFYVQDSSPGLPEDASGQALHLQGLQGVQHPLGLESGLRLSCVSSVAAMLGGDSGIDSVCKTGMTCWFTARLELKQS